MEDFRKKEAIKSLKRFNYLETSIEDMQEQIDIINSQMFGSGYCMSLAPAHSGSNIEDMYNEHIDRKNNLEIQINNNKKECELIKQALNKLTKDEQTILKYAYINNGRKNIDAIKKIYNIETAQAYRYINNALKKYILVRYGV